MLPAPREAVFAAMASSEQLRRWWGPRGFAVPTAQLDVRPGGAYRIAMRPPEGDVFHLAGTFRAVVPPARLSYTFNWEPPDADDRETLVELTLREDGVSTQLELVQGPFLTEERLALHRNGWTETLERLGDYLGAAR